MTHPDPAAALNGVQAGNICDRCNGRIVTGDKAAAYCTYYKREGWTIRRVWCHSCGNRTINNETEGADEAVVEAIYWSGRLVSVATVDRSSPSC